MAYSGYLLKIGNFVFPHKYIKFDTYSPYANMQDINDYTDSDGYLHRQAVDLKALKVEFETPAMITNTQFAELMSNLRANFTIPKARQCVIEAYIPESDSYVTQTGYMADFTPKIYMIKDNVIKYNPIRFAFIGGVANE